MLIWLIVFFVLATVAAMVLSGANRLIERVWGERAGQAKRVARRAALVTLSLAALAFVGYLTVSGQWLNFVLGNGLLLPYSDDRYEHTVGGANAIIAALNRWKVARGDYPESLAALVPGELAELPAPSVGKGRWKYDRPEPGRFVLTFFVGPIYESDWFDSAKGEWYIDR